jgi:hypothetical protein
VAGLAMGSSDSLAAHVMVYTRRTNPNEAVTLHIYILPCGTQGLEFAGRLGRTTLVLRKPQAGVPQAFTSCAACVRVYRQPAHIQRTGDPPTHTHARAMIVCTNSFSNLPCTGAIQYVQLSIYVAEPPSHNRYKTADK